MTVKEIRTKVLRGDFSSLLNFGSTKNYAHPSETAHLIISLPDDVALQTFLSLPEDSCISAFSYLPIDWQKKIIKGIPKEKAADILNKLPSDDRFEFYSKLRGVEQSNLLAFQLQTKTCTEPPVKCPD